MIISKDDLQKIVGPEVFNPIAGRLKIDMLTLKTDSKYNPALKLLKRVKANNEVREFFRERLAGGVK